MFSLGYNNSKVSASGTPLIEDSDARPIVKGTERTTNVPTPIPTAVMHKDTDELSNLIAKGEDFNQVMLEGTFVGFAPIHLAVLCPLDFERQEMVNILIAAGANLEQAIQAGPFVGLTALQVAEKLGQTATVQQLQRGRYKAFKEEVDSLLNRIKSAHKMGIKISAKNLAAVIAKHQQFNIEDNDCEMSLNIGLLVLQYAKSLYQRNPNDPRIIENLKKAEAIFLKASTTADSDVHVYLFYLADTQEALARRTDNETERQRYLQLAKANFCKSLNCIDTETYIPASTRIEALKQFEQKSLALPAASPHYKYLLELQQMSSSGQEIVSLNMPHPAFMGILANDEEYALLKRMGLSSQMKRNAEMVIISHLLELRKSLGFWDKSMDMSFHLIGTLSEEIKATLEEMVKESIPIPPLFIERLTQFNKAQHILQQRSLATPIDLSVPGLPKFESDLHKLIQSLQTKPSLEEKCQFLMEMKSMPEGKLQFTPLFAIIYSEDKSLLTELSNTVSSAALSNEIAKIVVSLIKQALSNAIKAYGDELSLSTLPNTEHIRALRSILELSDYRELIPALQKFMALKLEHSTAQAQLQLFVNDFLLPELSTYRNFEKLLLKNNLLMLPATFEHYDPIINLPLKWRNSQQLEVGPSFAVRDLAPKIAEKEKQEEASSKGLHSDIPMHQGEGSRPLSTATPRVVPVAVSFPGGIVETKHSLPSVENPPAIATTESPKKTTAKDGVVSLSPQQREQAFEQQYAEASASIASSARFFATPTSFDDDYSQRRAMVRATRILGQLLGPLDPEVPDDHSSLTQPQGRFGGEVMDVANSISGAGLAGVPIKFGVSRL